MKTRPSSPVGSMLSTLLWGCLWGTLVGPAEGKWVQGHVDTKENWAFLERFCFLSIDGQFEYLIEFDRDMGTPNLLLYYDDDSQWPAVYHSSKTCKEREAVLNKHGQNQIIRLSHWYPDTEYSGCVITKENRELPAVKSSTTTSTSTSKPTTKRATITSKPKNSTKVESPEPSYYDQFLKTTPSYPKATNVTISDNSTTWYEVFPTDIENSTDLPVDELWETIGTEKTERLENEKYFDDLKDVEIMFDNRNNESGHKIKRSTFDLYERFRRRRLKSESDMTAQSSGQSGNTERLVVSCHNSRRFRSARERWWFIAISNCDSNKGLDVKYKFLMTNGPDGDFWHEHFSADETYVLPVLLAYSFAYVIVMVAVVMCSVELKSRHLLHSTYKLFLVSIVAQHFGAVLQSLAYIRYATTGVIAESVKVTGQFFCGMSELTFLLVLLLMAKGYTITNGRLKLGFTIRLTVFVCAYLAVYCVLFVCQAQMFDPGEVLYLYESPAGYGLIVLRVLAWCVFAYATFFTVRKHPEKNQFYCPFFICGTLWFYAGPLFILTANNYIDKWVRESVVIAVLLFITFCGHIMFLLLTLPVFANKNFPYHVRTTQIGVMEVTGNPAIDGFGPNPYHPTNGAPQTVIIPLTRRTEELIGNMYSQYMASAPPLSPGNTETPKLNGATKNPAKTLIQQDSTDTNTSEDIKPYVKTDKEIFTVEGQMSKIDRQNSSNLKTNKEIFRVEGESSKIDHQNSSNLKKDKEIFTVEGQMSKIERQNSDSSSKLPHEKIKISPITSPQTSLSPEKVLPDSDSSLPSESLPPSLEYSRSDLPSVLRTRRTILEPLKRDEVPSWSLAKGPSVVAMQRKASLEGDTSPTKNSSFPPLTGATPLTLPKKVPPVRNGLQPSSGEISTIREGHIQSYKNGVSRATIDLFTANSTKG